METKIRILHFDDDSRDAELIHAALTRNGLEFEVWNVAHRTAYENALASGGFDVILCDYSVPGYDICAALKKAAECQPHVPVIVVTGAVTDEQAVQCLKNGATDYLLKERLHRLAPAVRRAFEEGRKRRRIDSLKRQSETIRERHRTELLSVINNTLDAMVIVDRQDRIKFLNPAAKRLFNRDSDELTDRPFDFEENSELSSGEYSVIQIPCEPDGHRFAEMCSSTIHWEGSPARIISLRDITDRIRAEENRANLEAQLRMAKKFEAIATLVGGIADHFNNFLTPILGNLELALMDPNNPSAIHDKLIKIRDAGDHARDLVNRVSAFSRRMERHRETVLLEPIVASCLEKVVAQSEFELVRRFDPHPIAVHGNAAELEKVVFHLMENAKQALPENNGRVTVTLDLHDITESTSIGHFSLPKGHYVRVSVEDNGHGMDPSTLERVFEPFFTLNRERKAVGLGLSTVYGIVKTHCGAIHATSTPGIGTTFEVFLPVECHGEPSRGSAPPKPVQYAGSPVS